MLDPDAVPLPARRVSGERREAVGGRSAAGRLLTVVYTERGDRYRIVTARGASWREGHLYWNQR